MPILNEGLTSADFKVGQNRFGWSMRQTELNGFLGVPRVEILRGGTRIFKLTAGDAPEGNFGVTGWWSTVLPWKEDTEGAKGRFEQAVLNGIDMSSMVRYMSAVVISWNALDNYVEVTVHPDWEIHCFWGVFRPMRLIADAEGKGEQEEAAARAMVAERSMTKSSASGYANAVLPDDLGPLEAWQFYIGGLKNEHLEGGASRNRVIDAHNMEALAAYFGTGSRPMPSPPDFWKATSFSQVQGRDKNLLEMDKWLSQLRPRIPDLEIPTQRNALNLFCRAGDEYRLKSTDPLKVKTKVEEYVRLGREWMRT